MAVVRKVTSRVVKTEKAEIKSEPVVSKESAPVKTSSNEDRSDNRKVTPRSRKCVYCTAKTNPKYWDSSSLRRYVNDRGRIAARTRTNLCAKHQKRVAKQVKYARHLALLPFMVRV